MLLSSQARITTVLLLPLLGLAGACRRSPAPIAIHAAICGKLCGDPTRAPDDFSGLACATAARIRILNAGGGGADAGLEPAGDPVCVRFDDSSTYRLVDLFHTSDSAGPGSTVQLPPIDPNGRIVVEVALYAPSGPACPAENAPLLAIGRSAVIDVAAHAGGVIDVPLGCRSICGTRTGIMVKFGYLEDDTDVLPEDLPSDITLGEIYSYAPLVSTAGVCTAPSLAFPSGEFRPFDAVRDQDNFFAVSFDVDHAANAGCVAARVVYPEGVIYACLDKDGRAHLVTRAHLAALVADTQGALGMVAASARKSNYDPTSDAQLYFGSPDGGVSGEYAADDGWMEIIPGGTTGPGLGLAVMRNAPTGWYTMRFRDDVDQHFLADRTFNAGGANDPRSITTVFVVNAP